MKKILEKLKNENEIVSFYTDGDTETCYTGFVSEVDDDYVLIAHISDSGLYDGFILRELADIQHIETGGEYEEMIGKLYKLKKQSHRKLNMKEAPCLMDALLEYCCEEKPFIATKFSPDDESSIRGVLQEAGDVLIIQRYFNAGIKDALVYLNKEDIKILSIDTCQEQNVCLLSQITEE